MNYKEYSEKTTAITTRGVENNLVQEVLGIIGETGKFADKLRFYGFLKDGDIKKDKIDLMQKLGDVFWYVNALCVEVKIDFVNLLQKSLVPLERKSDLPVSMCSRMLMIKASEMAEIAKGLICDEEITDDYKDEINIKLFLYFGFLYIVCDTLSIDIEEVLQMNYRCKTQRRGDDI